MVHRSALDASRIRAQTIQTRKVFDIFKGRIIALVESPCRLEHSLANREIAGRKNLFQNRDFRRLVIYGMDFRKLGKSTHGTSSWDPPPQTYSNRRQGSHPRDAIIVDIYEPLAIRNLCAQIPICRGPFPRTLLPFDMGKLCGKHFPALIGGTSSQTWISTLPSFGSCGISVPTQRFKSPARLQVGITIVPVSSRQITNVILCLKMTIENSSNTRTTNFVEARTAPQDDQPVANWNS